MAFVLIIISLVHFLPASAEEVGRRSSNSASSQLALPKCVNDVEEVRKIKSLMKANRTTAHKYIGYQEALKSETVTDLFARLVYAETLAANCPDKNKLIAPKIAESIGYRIQKREGDVKGVIFQRDQFSSSLNDYGKSQLAEFLCPSKSELWQISKQEAQRTLNEKKSGKTVNYFLYKHSPDWPEAPKSWAGLEVDKALTTTSIQDCVKFFKNPTWR